MMCSLCYICGHACNQVGTVVIIFVTHSVVSIPHPNRENWVCLWDRHFIVFHAYMCGSWLERVSGYICITSQKL